MTDDNYTDDPRKTELMNELTGHEAVPLDASDEMISKAAADLYIEEKINAMWADKVKMETEAKRAKLEHEEEVISTYNDTMKASDEPWVDLKGYTETSNGLKISLDWNNAFIEHLRAAGMKGVDDEQIVHTWLAMLMKDVSTKTDDGKGDFED